ncbi:hypothetical protein CBR_g37316 [Chara braunii]|uniref:DUF659 domain-containing protein n=1 Tax=Chara braunii TaxID=69332 RepID=A0A388JZJ3_CHABU|nr:hypothetical protein CBR_g37316 [Chara braunii]|eukprot:GBG63230.1 hypothetical protein CBR_g37316 [Chara braunii]
MSHFWNCLKLSVRAQFDLKAIHDAIESAETGTNVLKVQNELIKCRQTLDKIIVEQLAKISEQKEEKEVDVTEETVDENIRQLEEAFEKEKQRKQEMRRRKERNVQQEQKVEKVRQTVIHTEGEKQAISLAQLVNYLAHLEMKIDQFGDRMQSQIDDVASELRTVTNLVKGKEQVKEEKTKKPEKLMGDAMKSLKVETEKTEDKSETKKGEPSSPPSSPPSFPPSSPPTKSPSPKSQDKVTTEPEKPKKKEKVKKKLPFTFCNKKDENLLLWITKIQTYCSTALVEPESQVALSTSCLGGEAKEWVLAEANAAGFDDIGEWAGTLNLKQFLGKIKERFLDKTTADKAFDQLTTIGQRHWTSVESLSQEVDRLLQVPGLNLQDNQVLYIYSRALPEPIRGQLVAESKSGKYNYRQFRDLALQRVQMTSQGNATKAARHVTQPKYYRLAGMRVIADVWKNTGYTFADKTAQRVQRWLADEGMRDTRTTTGGQRPWADEAEREEMQDFLDEQEGGEGGLERARREKRKVWEEDVDVRDTAREKRACQTTIDEMYAKEKLSEFTDAWLQWIYAKGLSFNASRGSEFQRVRQAVERVPRNVRFQFSSYRVTAGAGIPSQRGKVATMVSEVRSAFRHTDATILSDGRKSRSSKPLVNFLAGGANDALLYATVARDGSVPDTADVVYRRWRAIILSFPAKDVIGFCMDSTSNYTEATRRFATDPDADIRRITWLPYSTHVCNLMLSDVGTRVGWVKETIIRARALAQWVQQQIRDDEFWRSVDCAIHVMSPINQRLRRMDRGGMMMSIVYEWSRHLLELMRRVDVPVDMVEPCVREDVFGKRAAELRPWPEQTPDADADDDTSDDQWTDDDDASVSGDAMTERAYFTYGGGPDGMAPHTFVIINDVLSGGQMGRRWEVRSDSELEGEEEEEEVPLRDRRFSPSHHRSTGPPKPTRPRTRSASAAERQRTPATEHREGAGLADIPELERTPSCAGVRHRLPSELRTDDFYVVGSGGGLGDFSAPRQGGASLLDVCIDDSDVRDHVESEEERDAWVDREEEERLGTLSGWEGRFAYMEEQRRLRELETGGVAAVTAATWVLVGRLMRGRPDRVSPRVLREMVSLWDEEGSDHGGKDDGDHGNHGNERDHSDDDDDGGDDGGDDGDDVGFGGEAGAGAARQGVPKGVEGDGVAVGGGGEGGPSRDAGRYDGGEDEDEEGSDHGGKDDGDHGNHGDDRDHNDDGDDGGDDGGDDDGDGGDDDDDAHRRVSDRMRADYDVGRGVFAGSLSPRFQVAGSCEGGSGRPSLHTAGRMLGLSRSATRRVLIPPPIPAPGTAADMQQGQHYTSGEEGLLMRRGTRRHSTFMDVEARLAAEIAASQAALEAIQRQQQTIVAAGAEDKDADTESEPIDSAVRRHRAAVSPAAQAAYISGVQGTGAGGGPGGARGRQSTGRAHGRPFRGRGS